MHRIVFTVRRTAHIVAASIAVELALDFGAGAAAVIVAPFIGTWVYAVAGVIVVGSLPVLGLNIARVARREWRAHPAHEFNPTHYPPRGPSLPAIHRARDEDPGPVVASVG